MRYDTRNDWILAKERSGVGGFTRYFCRHLRRVLEQKNRLGLDLCINDSDHKRCS